MEKEIMKLKDHYIICGFGRIGGLIAEQLSIRKEKFIVIENDANALSILENRNYLHIQGNATSDENLLEARIKEARALVSVVKSDADNIFITLCARDLNTSILIIARYESESAMQKLKKAGANRVLSPYQIGGYKMAQILLRPNVNDFLEFVSSGDNCELSMEEVYIHSHYSQFIGKTIINSRIKQDYGLTILGIKRKGGEILYNPSLDTYLEENDILITFGNHKQIKNISAN